jgi:hypothetical protein
MQCKKKVERERRIQMGYKKERRKEEKGEKVYRKGLAEE